MNPGLFAILLLTVQVASSAQVTTALPELRIEAGLAGHIKPYLDLANNQNAARVKTQKRWDPLVGPIPLQPHEASQSAETWLLSQPETPVVHSIKNIQLHRCPYPLEHRWFYIIQFSLLKQHQSQTRFAIVLFDRTVIEPLRRER